MFQGVKLTYFVYATAILAVAVATFGPGGIFAGAAIVAFWAAVFRGRNRPRRLFEASVVMLVLLFLGGLLLPAVSIAREAARRMQCSSHLKGLALALHNYHDVYETLPPAYLTDSIGRPMHSWRVLILPFIEHQSLYEQYRFDEPWDGPHNRTLADHMPRMFACPSNAHRHRGRPTTTSYVAVVGTGTAWPQGRSRSFEEFSDSPADTLLVMEYHAGPSQWMDPREPTDEQAVRAFASPTSRGYGHMHQGFFYNTAYGRNILLADGSLQFVQGHLSEAIAVQLLDVDNEAPSTLDGKSTVGYYRQANYGNWFRLAFFLLVAFLPMPWVWIRPNHALGRSTEGQPRHFFRLLPNSSWGLQMRFSCQVIQASPGDFMLRYDGTDLGPVEVRAPTREQALEKMRGELRYRLELCPCSGETYRDIRIELREA